MGTGQCHIAPSRTQIMLGQISLAALFLCIFLTVHHQKLLFFFESAEQRFLFIFALDLFRRFYVITPTVDHIVILLRTHFRCSQIFAVLQIFHPVLFIYTKQTAVLLMPLELLFITDNGFRSVRMERIQEHIAFLMTGRKNSRRATPTEAQKRAQQSMGLARARTTDYDYVCRMRILCSYCNSEN